MNNIDKIVKLAIKNNALAQREIYSRYHAEMLGISIRMVGQRDVADDVVQEGFIKVFANLKKLKDPTKIRGWIKRIVLNEALSYIRKVQYFEPIDQEKIEEHYEEEECWYSDISFDKINQEIDRLPNGSRQIFTLYLIEQYKHREIAEMMNISVSTVKSQYQYALKILRSNLKEVI